MTFGAGGGGASGGGSGPVVPTTCAEANDQIGCCSPDGSSAYFCDKSGKFTAKSCSSGNDCGWVAASKFYNCGGNGADPSGAAPQVCGGGSTGGSIIPKTCAQAHDGAGCCGPDGAEYYCASGSTTVKRLDCKAMSMKCGWNSAKHYDCGSSGSADPSGANPIDCGP